MQDLDTQTQKQLSRFLTIASVCLIAVILHFAQTVTIPLALALLVTFVLRPAVASLERKGVQRAWAVTLTGILVVISLAEIGWITTREISDLSSQTPFYQKNLSIRLKMLGSFGRQTVSTVQTTLEELQRAYISSSLGKPATADLSSPRRDGMIPGSNPDLPIWTRVVPENPSPLDLFRIAIFPVLRPFLIAAVVGILACFMLMQREELRDRLISLIGAGRLNETTQALNEAAARLSSYLVSQALVNLSFGFIIAAGLWLIGLPNSLLWGLIAVPLRFLPGLGVAIAAVPPIILSFLVAPGWIIPSLTIGLIILTELLISNLIEPTICGKRAGLSGFAIFVCALFWAWVWGIPGLLLSTPLSVCFLVIGKYVPQLSFFSILLGDEPALPAHLRLYQRLLAFNHIGVKAIVDETIKSQTAIEIHDSLILPVVALLQSDVRAGRIDDQTETLLLDSIDVISKSVLKNAVSEDLPADELQHRPRSQSILCLPAHGRADELVGTMLARFVELAGGNMQVASAKTLSGEMADLISESGAEIIVVSALPPGGLDFADYIFRRIGALPTGMKTISGIWVSDVDNRFALSKLPSHTTLAKTFREALDDIRRASTLRSTLSLSAADQPDPAEVAKALVSAA